MRPKFLLSSVNGTTETNKFLALLIQLSPRTRRHTEYENTSAFSEKYMGGKSRDTVSLSFIIGSWRSAGLKNICIVLLSGQPSATNLWVPWYPYCSVGSNIQVDRKTTIQRVGSVHLPLTGICIALLVPTSW